MIDSNIQNAMINLAEACDTIEDIARTDSGITFISDVREDLFKAFRLLAEVEQYMNMFIDGRIKEFA